MHEETDPEYARFFSYLNLFCFFMLMLVLGSNVLVMFVGWEGVGLCSYLLIGFYYQKQSASDAAKKAFVVNRIGDFAFILGALLMVTTFGSLDFTTVALAVEGDAGRGDLRHALADHAAAVHRRHRQVGADSALRLAARRDGGPDAGVGPDPRRDHGHRRRLHDRPQRRAVRARADHARASSPSIGAATALFAGTIGLVQNDIKRVLAYSTVSQLGYMFLAMGVGAFGAGIFHLYTHAFFKALLFLGSGAVIHALHGEQDIRNMGGLKKHLPITYWTFVIGVARDRRRAAAGRASSRRTRSCSRPSCTADTRLLWVVGALTSLLTATYMFRLVHLTFHGEERFGAACSHGARMPHGARAPVARRAPVHAHGTHLRTVRTVRTFMTRRRRWRSR